MKGMYVTEGSNPPRSGYVHPLLREERPVYTDSRLERITQEHPVSANVGGILYTLLRGVALDDRYAMSVFGGSPAQNSKTEDIFGKIVRRSAVEGRWVGYELEGWTPASLDEFLQEKSQLGQHIDGRLKSGMRNDFHEGLSRAINARLLRLEVFEGKVYAVPTEEFVRYAAERVQHLSRTT